MPFIETERPPSYLFASHSKVNNWSLYLGSSFPQRSFKSRRFKRGLGDPAGTHRALAASAEHTFFVRSFAAEASSISTVLITTQGDCERERHRKTDRHMPEVFPTEMSQTLTSFSLFKCQIQLTAAFIHMHTA